MSEELLKVFDAWADLAKARKAKGLAKWDRLQHMAEKLDGKSSKDITFTSCHPKYGSKGRKHHLGSTDGNLHFLSGYVSPGFHVAPYHWQIVFPELEDEEAEALAASKGHPADIELWKRSGIDVVFEGDLMVGEPHSWAKAARKIKDVEQRSMKAESPYGKYTVDPVEGLVFDQEHERVYKWDLVRDSYFAAINPEIAEVVVSYETDVEKSSHLVLPPMVSQLRAGNTISQLSGEGVWDDSVYTLVKSHFPKPGSVVLMDSGNETIYGLVKSDSVDLIDAAGHPVSFEVHGREYHTIDLTKGGDIHPSIVFSFGMKYLGLDRDHLESFVKGQTVAVDLNLPSVVMGNPSPGFDNVTPDHDESLRKSVVVENHTYRLRVEAD